MSEINTGATEESILDSIEELGGIPVIDLELSVNGMTAYPTDKTLSVADMPADAKVVGDDISDLQAALAGVGSEVYPVGSIYMTTSSDQPYFAGTWVEIAMTATWAQLKTGKRDYAALGTGETGGMVHFWLRTA